MIDEKLLIQCLKAEEKTDRSKAYGEHECDLIEGTIRMCIDTVKAQPKVGEWIPCSERLPEDEKDVLVYFEYYRYGNHNCLYKTIGISYMYEGKWSGFVNGSSGWEQLRIIAWQPLPEDYKEKE